MPEWLRVNGTCVFLKMSHPLVLFFFFVVNPCAVSPKAVLGQCIIAPDAAVHPFSSAELGFGLFGMQSLCGTG